MKEREQNEEQSKCCMVCEWAVCDTEDDEWPESVLCEKTGKEKDAFACCRHFSYDLLKRVPRRHIEIPTLDPEALDL
ncbi:MAG: hypothetical protein J6125_04605 [Clostridia bacterium]|nr:hypothetical protein [Clostridia bacterium]